MVERFPMHLHGDKSIQTDVTSIYFTLAPNINLVCRKSHKIRYFWPEIGFHSIGGTNMRIPTYSVHYITCRRGSHTHALVRIDNKTQC